MSAIIPGFEYDIFISYRQKDNKYDGWVTEFVNNLKKELDATFKEEIAIYFDENPHNGILDTYNVDKSLENKIKCLIFIPIISQTYCDPRSFAWQNEFIAFNKMAREDVFGRDIRLENGNTASRIFPVKIHDIDATDKILLESELGGPIRSVEFIFKSPGGNRPLKPDDSRTENLNHTYYRDQINKVANAIKEIIAAMNFRDSGQNELNVRKLNSESKAGLKRSKKLNLKIAIWSFLVLLVAASGFLLLPHLTKTEPDDADKSIAVLPFENLSNDPKQDFFGDGIMQEILNHLFKIGGLKIPSGRSSMKYKGSRLSIRKIAKELNVSYILEGNVIRSGDSIRINLSLINGKNDRLLWTNEYRREITAINLLELQSEVARKVAENLKVVINPDVIERIEKKPTINTEAYNLVLQVQNEPLTFEQSKSNLERAISLDPQFADAYATMANLWIGHGGHGGELERDIVVKEATLSIDKAQQLDNNSLLMHMAKATLNLYYKWDFQTVQKELETFEELAPSNSDLINVFSDYLLATGNFKEALKLSDNAFKQNKSSNNWVQISLAYYHNNEGENAYKTISSAWNLFPGDGFIFTNTIRIFNYLEKYNETIEFFEKNSTEKSPKNLIPYHLGHMGVAYSKAGNKEMTYSYLNELISRSKKSPVGSPSFFAAAIYTSLGQTEKALESLDKAFRDHEVEMYWLKVEPLFSPLHGDPRFVNILKKIGFN
jgi:TolB-like protein